MNTLKKRVIFYIKSSYYFWRKHYGLIRKENVFLSFSTCRFGTKWTDNHGLYGLHLHNVGSCSIYGSPSMSNELKTFNTLSAKLGQLKPLGSLYSFAMRRNSL
jgi:hypothetical protein